MENYINELNVLADRMAARLKEREYEYQQYLSDTGLSPSVHTIGEFNHVNMEIDFFKKQAGVAQKHESTVPNFTIEYNTIMNKLNNIQLRSL